MSLKTIANTLNETLRNLASDGVNALDDLETPLTVAPWLPKNPSFPPVKHVACYAVRGSIEGYWIHVDFRYRGAIDGSLRATMAADPSSVSETMHASETVLIAKTFNGFPVAAKIASILSETIDRHGLFAEYL